jgi:putative ABC transport system permease protein
MFSSLDARSKQTATLMTLGFKSTPIALAFMFESIVLALLGGAIACLIIYFGFDGHSVSSFNSESFSQVVFQLEVSHEVILAGMLIALFIGLLAGLLPSIRSANQNIIQALNRS